MSSGLEREVQAAAGPAVAAWQEIGPSTSGVAAVAAPAQASAVLPQLSVLSDEQKVAYSLAGSAADLAISKRLDWQFLLLIQNRGHVFYNMIQELSLADQRAKVLTWFTPGGGTGCTGGLPCTPPDSSFAHRRAMRGHVGSILRCAV